MDLSNYRAAKAAQAAAVGVVAGQIVVVKNVYDPHGNVTPQHIVVKRDELQAARDDVVSRYEKELAELDAIIQDVDNAAKDAPLVSVKSAPVEVK